MMQIIVLDHDLYTPQDLTPKTLGSAGLDLKLTRDAKSATQIATEGGEWPYQDLIGTGIKISLPSGCVGLIVPRSSAGHKHGFRLGTTIGVIDEDYQGELMISVGEGDYSKLKRGAVVAQLIVIRYASFHALEVVEHFDRTTTRGEGGFGSTDFQPSISQVEAVMDDLAARGLGLQYTPGVRVLPTTCRGEYNAADHDSGCQQCAEREKAILRSLNGGCL